MLDVLRRSWRPLVGKIKNEKLFIFLSLIFVSFPATHMDFIPFWDGWEFFRHCYQGAASDGNFRCFGHNALAPSALYGLTQLAAPGNQHLVYILNMALGLLAIAFFRALLSHFFGDRLTRTERNLVAFLVGFNPILYAHILQPCLDYPLTLFFIVFLFTLVKRKYVATACVGTVMIFTKEPGVALYGATVAVHFLLLVLPRPFRFDFRPFYRRGYWVLFIPVLLMAVYVGVYPPQVNAGSWPKVFRSLVAFDLGSGFLHGQLLSAFVINFSWVPTAIVLLGGMVRTGLALVESGSLKPRSPGFTKGKEAAFVAISLLLLTYLMTRVDFANNPRYLLPLFPLLILLSADALLTLLPRRRLRILALAMMVSLVHVSSYRTLDPAAKRFFGTFAFGEHQMLKMTRFNELCSEMVDCPPGRDQLVYNLEFTRFHYLTEKIVQKYGLDKIYLIHPFMSWNGAADLGGFDARSKRRTLRLDAVVYVSMTHHEEFRTIYTRDKEKPSELYYIMYPNMVNDNELNLYLDDYGISRIETFSEDGYAIDVACLVRKGRIPDPDKPEP